MTFVPENDLERALIQATGDAAARPEFCRLLLASDLLVIGNTEHPGADGKVRVSQGENLQIASGEIDGKPFLPVFSSLTRLQAYIRSEQNYIALNGRTLFEVTQGAYAILNPGSDYGKELLPEEIAGLLDPNANKPNRITVEQDTQVLIGQPAVYPHDLVNALKRCFAARDDIVSARLVQIAYPDAKQPPHPLIGVDMTGDWDSLATQIGRVAAAAVPGLLFDLTSLDRKKPDGFCAALLATPPFYEKKKSLWRSIFN